MALLLLLPLLLVCSVTSPESSLARFRFFSWSPFGVLGGRDWGFGVSMFGVPRGVLELRSNSQLLQLPGSGYGRGGGEGVWEGRGGGEVLKYHWYYSYPGPWSFKNSNLSFLLGQNKDEGVVLARAGASLVAAIEG